MGRGANSARRRLRARPGSPRRDARSPRRRRSGARCRPRGWPERVSGPPAWMSASAARRTSPGFAGRGGRARRPRRRARHPTRRARPSCRGLAVAAVAAPPVVTVEPTMISVAHWGRLEAGALFAWSRRLEWAVMMKRTFGFDLLRCPRCSRRMRVLSTITEPPVVHEILGHLGVRASPLPRAPAREPDWEQVDLGFEGFDAAWPSAAVVPDRGRRKQAPRRRCSRHEPSGDGTGPRERSRAGRGLARCA